MSGASGTVGVVEVWAAVEMAYQRQAIDAHDDRAKLIRQAIPAGRQHR
jgi:hypothetical protein